MQKENVLIFLLIKIIVKGEKKMKKIYNKPTMILVKMETEHFIAASPGKVDQNQIVHEGTGTNVGGTSSEGGNEDNGNGSVAAMAKPYNPWTAWDEQKRE